MRSIINITGVCSLLLACIACCADAATTATWAPDDLPKLQQTMLRAPAGAVYRIIVASPAGPPPAGGYPVIYVLDGNALTALVSEIIRINIGLGTASWVEPAVVVGIGYPIAAAYDIGRRSFDLTPPMLPGWTPPGGSEGGATGGDVALMDFINHDVKPVIEARFPIDRSRQTLLGHSLGGLFTLNTMLDRPSSFQTYVALSPSVYWNDRALLRNTRRFLAAHRAPARLRVFISVGEAEQAKSPSYLAHARAVLETQAGSEAKADADLADLVSFYGRVKMVTNARAVAALLVAGHVQTTFDEIPGADHFSSIPAALGRGVPFVFDDRLERDAQPARRAPGHQSIDTRAPAAAGNAHH